MESLVIEKATEDNLSTMDGQNEQSVCPRHSYPLIHRGPKDTFCPMCAAEIGNTWGD